MDQSKPSNDYLIISVKEARKLLGKKYDYMSDDQIEDLIIQLDDLARLSLSMAREKVQRGEKLK